MPNKSAAAAKAVQTMVFIGVPPSPSRPIVDVKSLQRISYSAERQLSAKLYKYLPPEASADIVLVFECATSSIYLDIDQDKLRSVGHSLQSWCFEGIISGTCQ
jgi:hypothetical protein